MTNALRLLVGAWGFAGFCFLLAACGNQGAQACSELGAGSAFFGQPVRVIDGDSLVMRHRNGMACELRLWAADTPELHQKCKTVAGELWSCGEAVRRVLEKLLGRTARCELTADKKGAPVVSFDRLIAQCWQGDEEISLRLIKDGFAIQGRAGRSKHYGTDAHKSAERSARRGKRGLWQGCFTLPHRWRNGQRQCGDA